MRLLPFNRALSNLTMSGTSTLFPCHVYCFFFAFQTNCSSLVSVWSLCSNVHPARYRAKSSSMTRICLLSHMDTHSNVVPLLFIWYFAAHDSGCANLSISSTCVPYLSVQRALAAAAGEALISLSTIYWSFSQSWTFADYRMYNWCSMPSVACLDILSFVGFLLAIDDM